MKKRKNMEYRDVLIVVQLFVFFICYTDGSACSILNTTVGFTGVGSTKILPTPTGLGEDVPIGYILTQLKMEDPNGVTLTGRTNYYFELLPNGSVRLKHKLDAENITLLAPFYIDCKDNRNSGGNKEIVMYKPSLLDVNEFSPSFKKQHYYANVSEAAPIGTSIMVFKEEVTDQDIDNQQINFNMSGSQTQFSIESQNEGDVKVSGPLDYEIQREVTLVITASDLGRHDVSRTSSIFLTIYIEDVDDQNPKFIGAPYSAIMAENETTGSVVNVNKPIKAFDQDVTINSAIEYVIENGLDGDFFDINSETGVVTLKKPGIRRGQTLTVTIRAIEVNNRDRSDTATLTITVSAVNENPPLFEFKEYTKSVMENTLVNTVIMNVKATDNDLIGLGIINSNVQPEVIGSYDAPDSRLLAEDEGAFLKYSMKAPLVDKFEIDEVRGDIKLIGQLDYEDVKQYTLYIQVSDGKYTDTASVTIQVLDVNDNNPVFKKDVYEINAPREKGVIGTVSATDRDMMSSLLTYVLKTYTRLFSIDSKTGVIMVIAEPGNITQDVYILTVEARDSDQSPRTSTAHVTVQFPARQTASTLTPGATAQNQNSNIIVYALAGIAGFLLIVCIILAILTLKFVRKEFVANKSSSYDLRRNQDEIAKITRRHPPEGLVYNSRDIPPNMTITDFLDEGATSTQENPLALENPGYFYEDDESDIHEGQLRRVDEILVDGTVNNGNGKPMGSPTSTNSSTTSLIGALKKEDDLIPRKKKSLSWGKNQQEIFNSEAPIDPEASVRPMDEADLDNGKPKITLYF